MIVGSGCAGLTAAIYAARADLNPLVIDGSQPGGQLTTTGNVENFPGFPDGIDGFSLTDGMRRQAERFGTRFVGDAVVDAALSDGEKRIVCAGGTYSAGAVIVATGASPKLLAVPGEGEFFGGRGVSVCATCDGAFYRGKIVAVVGGGDTACEEALFLSTLCPTVYLIHRRDTLRASAPLRERVLANGRIVPVWNTAIDEISGGRTVEGVRVRNVVDGSTATIDCAGVFLAIGHTPNTQPFAGCLRRDADGYLLRRENSFVETDIAGVFVAGDCADPVYRQAIAAAGTGAMAAMAAERYIRRHGDGRGNG